MSDRMLDVADRAFVAAVERHVARLFEANRQSPNPSPKIPILGEMLWVDWKYDPHAPAEAHAEFMALAVKGALARKWFESQLPPWMQPLQLPLNEDERVALNNSGDRRLGVVASYALHELQSRNWEYERARPFIDYYAGFMAG